ncbi:S8 family serine peptidase [Promicromonospora kroppenstedtii]|uniref:S8 family serine peptidase n=1 Tax=Promicromonospora kroppenstedtii TaxID=440482 RepID=A0ABW7XIG9_9MICO
MKRKSFVGAATSAALVVVALTAVAPGAHAATSDPLRDRQWGLDQINAETAWRASTGEGVVVAVVDTGVDLDQPDLAGQLLPGATFTGCVDVRPCGDGDFRGPDGANDGDEHGTHVAGIVAAATDNGIGVAGVAPDAEILPVKVLEAGTGSSRDIADGIRWAADHGADVINLSLGSGLGGQLLTIIGVDTLMRDAIAYAREQGALTVAAAGNSSTPLCSDPAFTSAAICVGATDSAGLHSYYSELPVKLDLKSVSAPGGSGGLTGCDGDVWSTVPEGTGSDTCAGGSYDAYAGTSMATPHVAGVAALLFAQGRSLADVEAAVLYTARDPLLGLRGLWTPLYGYGILDAAAAVAY